MEFGLFLQKMLNINKKFYKNKRADLPITLLVVLVLILCVTAAFIFLTKQNSYERNMQQVRVIPATYANEEAFIFYIKNLAEGIIKDNPNIDSQSFINSFQAQYLKDNISEYNSLDFKNQILDK